MSDPTKPTGFLCEYCREPVKVGEPIYPPNPSGLLMHRECAIRATIGSAAHILKECTCYGGTRHDPPNITLREAARLAAQAFDEVGFQPDKKPWVN